MDWIDALIIVGRTVVAFGIWLIGTAIMIWAERRIVSKMQSRIGPNRLGPFGILQSLADGAKLFFKEDISPSNVDRWVYGIAPIVSATVGLLTMAVIPYGGSFEVSGRTVDLQVWDPDIGMLWVLAMSSLGVYGIVLGGWSSGSKYPLLGSVRSGAQMISYELAMSLGLGAIFIYTGSLRTSDIVAAQAEPILTLPVLGWALPAWNIIPQFVAFVLFFGSAIAEAQRPPFDLPEAEGELVAGFHTEYSGAKFAMFMLSEFMAVLTMSAITVTLFLGGPAGPLFGLEGTFVGALLGVGYFLLKTIVFIFVFVWLRGTLPRMRYDRLMDLGWRVLLPLGLLWVLVTGAIVVARQSLGSPDIIRYAMLAFGVVLIGVFLAPLLSRLSDAESADDREAHPDRGDLDSEAALDVRADRMRDQDVSPDVAVASVDAERVERAELARQAARDRTPDQVVL
ncbi:MAG: complex I subunit 1/NuoH family protein [Egibacteraceae bacterium]